MNFVILFNLYYRVLWYSLSIVKFKKLFIGVWGVDNIGVLTKMFYWGRYGGGIEFGNAI